MRRQFLEQFLLEAAQTGDVGDEIGAAAGDRLRVALGLAEFALICLGLGHQGPHPCVVRGLLEPRDLLVECRQLLSSAGQALPGLDQFALDQIAFDPEAGFISAAAWHLGRV